MAASESEQRDSQERAGAPPGRLRSAWSVLRGQALVPEQIAWEWAEYKAVFTELLQKYSAMLARMAKAEKKRAEQLAELDGAEAESYPAPANRKAELRRRAAELRGLPSRPVRGSVALHLEPEDETEDET